MNWDCTESDKRLSDYLEGLTTPEETTAFSAHLEHCADCTALVARVGGTVRMLRATPAVDVPPQLFRNIVKATSGARETAHGWRRWVQPVKIAWQPQFAMGALTIAASFLIIFHAANSSRSPRSFETLNPVNLFRTADRQFHLTYAHTARFVSDMRLVYEIESRFDLDQNQDSQAPPAQQDQNQNSQPQSQSQPKSQAVPRRMTGFAHGRSFYASETPQDFYVTVTRSRS